VLTVRNDELAVRDDDDVSSEVAETRAHAGEFQDTHVDGQAQSGKPAPVYQHS
jgi:hypothetical protein